jgi:hypothetical protein
MDVERVSPALYERLGAHASADLVVLLDAARKEWAGDVTAAIVDRFERRLTEEIAGVRVALAQMEGTLRAEMAALRTEVHDGDAATRQELHNVETRLTREVLTGRHELLKWVIVFWVTQMMAIGGLVAAMLRVAA